MLKTESPSFLHLLFSLLFETKNTPTHSYSYVRTCHRGATSLMGKWINSSHISVLSSNKLHDKVCRPNFYCFKFISSLVQFHKCPLPTSTNRELSIKFSFITFLIESIVNVSVSLVNTFLCFFLKTFVISWNSFSNWHFYKDWKPPSYWVFRHFFDIIY